MPSARKGGKAASASKKPAAKPSKAPAKKPTVSKPAVKTGSPPKKPALVAANEVVAPPVRTDARRHVLSLSFLRDGDEFLARLETDAGQITEMKNRSLDQLLTLVAGELEDLLE